MKANVVAISAFITCLTACGGSSSGSESGAGPSPLPSANSSLNTETPAGIWLIDSKQVGNYSLARVNTNMDTVRSVQQFVVINELADGRYSMPECGLDLFSDGNIVFNIENGKASRSNSSDLSDMSNETYALNFVFEENLKFSGTIDVTKQNSNDEYLYIDKDTANISAVKVSDSTDFESAEEISIAFSAQLNDNATLTLSDLTPSVICLGISSATYIGTLQSLTTSISEDAIHMTDADGNIANLEIEIGHLDSEIVNDRSYASSLASLKSHGVVSCAANADDCILTKFLTLNQNSIDKNSSLIGIAANVDAINENDESLNVIFSVEIK